MQKTDGYLCYLWSIIKMYLLCSDRNPELLNCLLVLTGIRIRPLSPSANVHVKPLIICPNVMLLMAITVLYLTGTAQEVQTQILNTPHSRTLDMK